MPRDCKSTKFGKHGTKTAIEIKTEKKRNNILSLQKYILYPPVALSRSQARRTYLVHESGGVMPPTKPRTYLSTYLIATIHRCDGVQEAIFPLINHIKLYMLGKPGCIFLIASYLRAHLVSGHAISSTGIITSTNALFV